MVNLEIYEKGRVVPDNAQRKITAGRLSGKTDINPMWRIKKLTELFGVCGIGWKINIKNKWLEQGANDEVSAFVEIELRVKVDNEWSDAIIGIGGSAYIAKEKNGLYTSDECYKMAYTDAISVACKMLGIGADVYWQADSTKYDKVNGMENNDKKENKLICPVCGKQVAPVKCKDGTILPAQKILDTYHKCANCIASENKAKKQAQANTQADTKQSENDTKNDATNDAEHVPSEA